MESIETQLHKDNSKKFEGAILLWKRNAFPIEPALETQPRTTISRVPVPERVISRLVV